MDERDKPATKGDLESALTNLREELRQEMRSSRQELRDELIEAMRDTETRLLQAFYGYAESNRKRVGQLDADTAILASRIGTLEDRLLQVEKRLNIPPQ